MLLSDSNPPLDTELLNSKEFMTPKKSLNERIDEFVSYNPDIQEDAERVKQILHLNWTPELPQPHINFSREDVNVFILVWLSHTVCKTLEINIKDGVGIYNTLCMQFEDVGWKVLDDKTVELNLNTAETWAFLKNDIAK